MSWKLIPFTNFRHSKNRFWRLRLNLYLRAVKNDVCSLQALRLEAVPVVCRLMRGRLKQKAGSSLIKKLIFVQQILKI